MKSPCVSDLADGQIVASLFLVREKEIRTSARSGKSWLELSLGDRTGSIPAKMWDNFDAIAKTFERDDVIRIRGRVKLYNGQKELTLEQIIPAAERDYELGDFLPHTKYDVEKLYADLRAAIAGMKNPWLQKLLASVVDDPDIAPRLKRAPAAMTMHHAYLGGLLEHVVSLVGLAAAVASTIPSLIPICCSPASCCTTSEKSTSCVTRGELTTPTQAACSATSPSAREWCARRSRRSRDFPRRLPCSSSI